MANTEINPIPDFFCQSGDITDGIGTGGESIYGLRFDDENFTRQHGGPGHVSKANYGPNSNSSQFHITTTMASWIDGKHVVFGRVLDGMDVLRKIEEVGSSSGQPMLPVIISHCGQLYI